MTSPGVRTEGHDPVQDGSGLRAGRTPIPIHAAADRRGEGREVGDDLRDVVVEARLLRSAASVAREGSVFWIVRLGTELQDISNLGTVITGAYIQVSPGTGEPKSDFVGMEGSQAPVEPGGLEIVLRANRLGSLKPRSPVYYRGIEVGACAPSSSAPIRPWRKSSCRSDRGT